MYAQHNGNRSVRAERNGHIGFPDCGTVYAMNNKDTRIHILVHSHRHISKNPTIIKFIFEIVNSNGKKLISKFHILYLTRYMQCFTFYNEFISPIFILYR